MNVVPASEVSAYFKLYKNEALTQEASSPLGGIVWVALYVRVGMGYRVTEATPDLTITVTDDYGDYEASTDVDAELGTVSMTSGQWESKPLSGGTWTSCSGPGYGANGGTEPMLYRTKKPWNTMTTPLGNNGDHTVAASAPVTFQGLGDPIGDKGPAAKTVTTENVWIDEAEASNGTIDYLKWDPEGGDELAEPHITCTIRDAAPSPYYVVAVFYAATMDDPTMWSDTWSVSEVIPNPSLGSPVPVDIDLRNINDSDHLSPTAHRWGTYTYDILVTEHTTNPNQSWQVIDAYQLKYPLQLYVPADAFDGDDDHEDGHAVWTTAKPSKIKIDYWLHSVDGSPAHDLGVTPIDARLEEHGRVSGLPATPGELHGGEDADQDGEPDGIAVYSFSGRETGRWRAVWTAGCNGGLHSPRRRTHDRQRMLAVNQELPTVRLNIVVLRGGHENEADRLPVVQPAIAWALAKEAITILKSAGLLFSDVEGRTLDDGDVTLVDANPEGVDLADETQPLFASGYLLASKHFEDPQQWTDEEKALLGCVHKEAGALNVYWVNSIRYPAQPAPAVGLSDRSYQSVNSVVLWWPIQPTAQLEQLSEWRISEKGANMAHEMAHLLLSEGHHAAVKNPNGTFEEPDDDYWELDPGCPAGWAIADLDMGIRNLMRQPTNTLKIGAKQYNRATEITEAQAGIMRGSALVK